MTSRCKLGQSGPGEMFGYAQGHFFQLLIACEVFRLRIPVRFLNGAKCLCEIAGSFVCQTECEIQPGPVFGDQPGVAGASQHGFNLLYLPGRVEFSGEILGNEQAQ